MKNTVRANMPRGVSQGRLPLHRCRSGAAAAEFALILPMLTALTFGTIEFGTMFFSYSAMQSSARDLSRQVAVNTMSPAAVVAEAKGRIPAWARSGATVTILQSAPGNPATNVYRLRIAVPASQATVLPFFSKAANFTLATEVHMKQELPFSEIKP